MKPINVDSILTEIETLVTDPNINDEILDKALEGVKEIAGGIEKALESESYRSDMKDAIRSVTPIAKPYLKFLRAALDFADEMEEFSTSNEIEIASAFSKLKAAGGNSLIHFLQGKIAFEDMTTLITKHVTSIKE